MQFGTALRNARADQIETTIGTAPLLEVRTGAAPAAPGDASTGTLLAQLTLPSDWLTAASGGQKTLSGSWSVAAVADGTAAHFRIFDSGGSTCHVQGTVSASGGGGELQFTTDNFVTGQTIQVTAFTTTEGNA